jgi:hypothetical protein
VPDEERERDGGAREQAEDRRRAPAVAVRLDEGVGEREESGAGRDDSADVDRPAGGAVAALLDRVPSDEQRDEPDRDVDPEDPAPAGVLGEQAARRRATANPSAPAAAQIPIALPRSASPNVADTIASVAGVISAAPTPWTTRAPTSSASPPASPPATDAPVKTASPARNARLRPKTSPIRPPVSRRAAKART